MNVPVCTQHFFSANIFYYSINLTHCNGFYIKLFFGFNPVTSIVYNHLMKRQQPRKRASMIFLILGIAFLTIGLASDQTAFTWIAIAFVVISLVIGGRWLRFGK